MFALLGVEDGTAVWLGIITLIGVIVTAICTILVARITSRTHTEVKSSNGTTVAHGVEAIRAFQIAHDVDDERRFMRLYGVNGLPVEEARSLSRDALVTDRRVREQTKGDAAPFPEIEPGADE